MKIYKNVPRYSKIRFKKGGQGASIFQFMFMFVQHILPIP